MFEYLQVHQCTKNILGTVTSKPVTHESYISAKLSVTWGYKHWGYYNFAGFIYCMFATGQLSFEMQLLPL